MWLRQHGIVTYQNRPPQHLFDVRSYVFPEVDDHSSSILIPFLCRSHHPARSSQIPAQNVQQWVLQWPPHSPALYKPLQHPSCPRNHCTRFPTLPCAKPPLCLHIDLAHSPASALWQNHINSIQLIERVKSVTINTKSGWAKDDEKWRNWKYMWTISKVQFWMWKFGLPCHITCTLLQICIWTNMRSKQTSVE